MPHGGVDRKARRLGAKQREPRVGCDERRARRIGVRGVGVQLGIGHAAGWRAPVGQKGDRIGRVGDRAKDGHRLDDLRPSEKRAPTAEHERDACLTQRAQVGR